MEVEILNENALISKTKTRNLLNTLLLKPYAGKEGVFYTKMAPQLNGMWEVLLAATSRELPMTKEPYFNPKIPGVYLNILDLSGIRVRASLNEDCVAPWTSGLERMRLDNFYATPNLGISSKPSPNSRRVILQRYSKHPRGLPISKKILSIPDAEKPHMFAEGTNALVLYLVKAPFEVQAEANYKRISADSKQILLDLIEKNPMLSSEQIQEMIAQKLDGQNVPDLKKIQFQQKKYLKGLFVQKKPKKIAESRLLQSEFDKDDNETETFQYNDLLGSFGLNDDLNGMEGNSFNDFNDLDEPNSSTNLSDSPLNALLMQTSSLAPTTDRSLVSGTSYEIFEQRIPSYYLDLSRGIPVKKALSTHGRVPETGNLFTGAQKIVLDGIVKTINELLKAKPSEMLDDTDSGINVLQLFPDVKPVDPSDF